MSSFLSEKTWVADGSSLESPIRSYGSVEIEARVSIGRFTVLDANCTVREDTSIGRFCSIGKFCEVGSSVRLSGKPSMRPFHYDIENHFSDFAVSPSDKETEALSGTEIGADVSVEPFVVIERGVRIGNGAIIRAGSVVTRDIPPYAIAAGDPCVVTGYRFTPDIISRLLETRWWNLPVQYVLSIDFSDINKALDQLEKTSRPLGSQSSLSPKVEAFARNQPRPLQSQPVEAKGDREPQLDEDPFFRFLSFKMEERGISAHIIAHLRKNRRSLFDNYNIQVAEELAILNNKIQYVADNFSDSPGGGDDLSSEDLLSIKRIFQSRA